MFSEKTINYKGGNLFYCTIGTGKPVVLIHGFGEDGNVWNTLAQALQENYFVIIPDIPGSGKSEILKSYEANEFSFDDFAEVINYILDEEALLECMMTGHSMGGYITLAFAEKYPNKLNSFGLFHSTALPDNEDKIEMRKKAIEFMKNNGAQPFLKTSLLGLFTDSFKNNFQQETENFIDSQKYFSTTALISYYEMMIRRPDRRVLLKKFKKPVLLIAGEKDKAIPINDLLIQSHLPSVCHFHIMSNSAHMGMMEEKDKSNSIISLFLEYVYANKN